MSTSPADPAAPSTTPPAPLDRECAELEYQCLLGARMHFVAAARHWSMYRLLGLTSALLGAVTTGSALEVVQHIPVLADATYRQALTGLLALALTVTTTALNFLDPKAMRDRNDKVAKDLTALGNQVRLLRRNSLARTPESRETRLNNLLHRHAEILVAAPAINDGIHTKAKQQLKTNTHYRELRPLTGRSLSNG